MNGILSVLHPTFDALSAHADRSDIAGTRTRVGRHLAGCAQCREIVADIHELGEAARAVAPPVAPAHLWARTLTGLGEARVAEPELTITGGQSAPRRDRRALAGLAVAAVAAVVAAVIVWPWSSGLQAAPMSRLTFSPTRPVPGGTVRVRYQPAAWMKDAERLLLVGRLAAPAGSNPIRFRGQLGDSLAVLTRGSDGAFVGTVRLPSDFLAAILTVLDPARDEIDPDGFAPWMIIGGTAARAPSLASFLAAQEIQPTWYGTDARTRSRQSVDAADSLKRHFPRHPAGWAFTRSYGMSKGKFDFLRFFQTAERKYASMFDELWPQRGLDGERLHDMVEFANNIGEPDEMLRWAARLVEEHPEDPRALTDLAGALHEVELRVPPALGDTIRAWLPALDRAYRAHPAPNRGFYEARRLVTAYGDSSTQSLWRGRADANGVIDGIGLLTLRPASDSTTGGLPARAEPGCWRAPGRYPLAQSIRVWQSRCELYRGIDYGFLSAQSLRDGRPRLALLQADSAIIAMRRSGFCAPSRAHLQHALASLALGDTATAETDYAVASAFHVSGETQLETVRARLGARVETTRHRAQVDSVRRGAKACEAEDRTRRQARDQRLGQ